MLPCYKVFATKYPTIQQQKAAAKRSINFCLFVQVYFEPRHARLYLTNINNDKSAADGLETPEVAYSAVGDRLQLNCQSGNSNPPAKFTWYRNGREVRGGQTIVKQGPNGGHLVTQVLRLNGGDPITSLDNGSKFSCMVSNPAINGNSVTKDYTLNVRCKDHVRHIQSIL